MSIESIAPIGGSLRPPPGGLTPVRNGAAPLPERAFSAILEAALKEPPEGDRERVVDKGGKLYEQCEALETFLMKTLLTGMRNTVPKTELLDGGFAGEIYEDMLYDEYAKDLTKYGGFGLAELAYLELTGQRGTPRGGGKPPR